MSRLTTVIETQVAIDDGAGGAGHGERYVTQYWSVDGKLLAQSEAFSRQESQAVRPAADAARVRSASQSGQGLSSMQWSLGCS